MKLLDKKRIASDFNAQKKAQIDEGVLIAKNVDKLREELASLEKQRKDFIAGSKLELEKETGALLEKIEVLKREVKKLEVKQAELKKPLDDEWAKLEENKAELAKAWDSYEITKHELSQKEKGIKEEEKRLEKASARLSQRAEDIEQLGQDAENLKAEAERINSEAKSERDQQAIKFSQANSELEGRQKQADIDAKNNARVKAKLDKKEIDLNNREKAINDKYQTLLRTINRTKNE